MSCSMAAYMAFGNMESGFEDKHVHFRRYSLICIF